MSLMNPWVLLGIAVALLGAGVVGARIESDHRDAQLLVQARVMHDQYVRRSAELRANADRVSEQLNREQAERDADREHFSRKLLEAINAKQLGKCEPAPGDKPDAAPTIFVNAGLWNAALLIGSRPGGDPRKPDGEDPPAGFAPLPDAYRNLAENIALCDRYREQVDGWQALAVKNGWVTSPAAGGAAGRAPPSE